MVDDKIDITSFVTDAIKAVTDYVAPAKKSSTKKTTAKKSQQLDLEKVLAHYGIKVKFVNEKHQEDNFEKSFAAYEDYNSENSLDMVEGQLCETIVKKIVDDIFNATVAQW